MLLELLRLLAAAALLVALPGFLLAQAAFPPARSRMTRVERAYVALAGGVMLLALVGVTLGSLPHGSGRGFFQTASTGAPYVEVALLAACVALFLVGLHRGAYPALAARWGLTTVRPASGRGAQEGR